MYIDLPAQKIPAVKLDEAPSKENPPVEPPMYPALYDTIDELIGVYNSAPIKSRIGPGTGYTNMSCGITTLYGIRSVPPAAIVRKILVERGRDDYKKIKEAFVQWSDIDHKGSCGGNALAAYIKDNNLGPVVEFGPRMNPNSGNMIKMWVWEPPHVSLKPKDSSMPVFGMKRIPFGSLGEMKYKDADGTSEVSDDTRFLEARFERGTTKA